MTTTHGLWADLARDLPVEQADVAVLGVPYDGSTCYRRGAAFAPDAIRALSHHLTPVTEDKTRLGGLAVVDCGDVDVGMDVPAGFARVRAAVAGLPRSVTPVILGGDHSITIPVFEAQVARYAGQRLGVLWVDAHPDLCDVFTESPLSHACVLRRGIEAGIAPGDVVLVGTRSYELQELDYMQHAGVHEFPMVEVARRGMVSVSAEAHALLARCDAVHVSLDIDCLDLSVAPGTGVPDAGGLAAREVFTLLKALHDLPLAGFDVVEVSPPIDPSQATTFAALKIVLEFFGVLARRG
jgi:agmatinase